MGTKALPTGTVTLMFTDVEGSTKLLDALGAAAYAAALAEHRRLVRAAVERSDGVEVDTQGDAFFFAFPDAIRCLAAAEEARGALDGGPVRIRMGIHTGRPLLVDEGYVGIDVHRAARIAAAAHGGQIFVSADAASAAAAVGDAEITLTDLGEHRLKDLVDPERIYQLGEGTFAPLMSLSASNLPIPATPFLGRAAEVEHLAAMVQDPANRLVTLVGPGGVGKTRLAIEAAARSSGTFLDGLWWVGLAPFTESGQAAAALARALGVREQQGVDVEQALAARLEGRRTLVLLDNAEHLLPDLRGLVTRLMAASDRLTVLVTSRERLRHSGERIHAVEPLDTDDAVALFQDRADALGRPIERDDTVDDVCAHLDHLPLALELAAARLRTFSLEQLLERLSGRLDVLKGNRDLEPRQQTLRATIEWSHDLLTPDEQTLFRRLAVFVDEASLEAAEAVCDADDEVLEGLLDKSLLQRRDDGPTPRFAMLESIADFAAERLAASGEESELRARHARYFRSLAASMDALIRAGEPEEGPVSVLDANIDDLRAAVEFGLATGDVGLVREITAALPMYWVVGGLYAEGRTWLERALDLDAGEDETRRRLLSGLATMAYAQGDLAAAVAASDAAATLALRLGGATEEFAALKERAVAALMSDDLAASEPLYESALAVAIAVGNGVGTSSCRLNLAYIANKTGRHDRAEALLAENLRFVRSKGQARCEANTLANLAETSLYRDEPEAGAADALLGAARALQIGDRPVAVWALDLVAVAAAARGQAGGASTILGATEAAREAMGVGPEEDEEWIRGRSLALIGGRGLDEAAWAAGRAMDLGAALEVASAVELGASNERSGS